MTARTDKTIILRKKTLLSSRCSTNLNTSNMARSAVCSSMSDNDERVLKVLVSTSSRRDDSSRNKTSTTTKKKEIIVDTPRDLDICCGRGKGFFSHPGNILFQESVRQNVERYRSAASKNLKSTVVADIVKDLLREGLRFIKRDLERGSWFVLSQACCHEKTGHAIRDHLIQMKRSAESAAMRATFEAPTVTRSKKNHSSSSTSKISPKQTATKKNGSGGDSTKAKHRIKKKTTSGGSAKKADARKTARDSITRETPNQSSPELPETTVVSSFFSGLDVVSLTSSSDDLQEYDLFDDLIHEEPPQLLPVELKSISSTSNNGLLTQTISAGSRHQHHNYSIQDVFPQHLQNDPLFCDSTQLQEHHGGRRRQHQAPGGMASTAMVDASAEHEMLNGFLTDVPDRSHFEMSPCVTVDRSVCQGERQERQHDQGIHLDSLGGRDLSLSLSIPFESQVLDDFFGSASIQAYNTFVGHRDYRVCSDSTNNPAASLLPHDWL